MGAPSAAEPAALEVALDSFDLEALNITLDTYSPVLPGLQEAAAAKLDAMLAEADVA